MVKFLGAFFLLFATISAEQKECVVLICNKSYFPKFLKTLNALREPGCYQGDICLVIGDDLVGDPVLNDVRDRVIIKHFPDLQFPESFLEVASKMPRFKSLFQYHKLYLFHPYFKQWDTLLYIDCGMHIYSDIRPILDSRQPHKLLAHSDTYPSYVGKLRSQFNQEHPLYYKLAIKFNLNVDYFQTTLLLFDTKIIQEETFDALYRLAVAYPISQTNEQGILGLYFTNIVPIWEQIPLRNTETFFYDFTLRGTETRYIMIKYTHDEQDRKFNLGQDPN